MTAHTLLSHQLLLHHHLGGNASVITARVPQRGLPAHPVPEGETQPLPPWRAGHKFYFCGFPNLCLPSSQCVLDGVGESVTQVEWSGHVGWRDTHHEDTTRVLLANTLPLREAEREIVLVFETKISEICAFKYFWVSVVDDLTPYSGLKNPCFSHHGYQAASTYWGL